MMKKSLILLCATAACLSSCTSEDITSTYEQNVDATIHKMPKKNNVTLDHVVTLVNVTHSKALSITERDVVCIMDDRNCDTLFFVVNHPEGGWTMYATDKRVPQVVAENEDGSFSLETTERIMGEWFEAMKEDMKLIRQAPDQDLAFTSEEIANHRKLWDAVCIPDTSALLGKNNQTRSVGDGNNPPINPLAGFYLLDTTYTHTQTIMQVGPLTQTAWSQGAPYNNFCPLKSYGYERAPAGCVAIAGAQMLYYLHYKLGTPDSIPSSATCSGYVPYNYTMWQGDYSSTQWNLMPNHGNSSDGLYAAPLIANIGYKLVMQYGNIVSTANTYELPSLVFLPYGISCEYSSINYDTVYNSLLDSIPLIARAGYIDGINGHAFIIDGYQSRRDVTTYVYKWHPAFIPLLAVQS